MDPERRSRIGFLPREGQGRPAIVRAEGAYLIAADGTLILDAAGGAIVVNIGHGRREVAEVAARALEEVTYVVSSFPTESYARLVERLLGSWLPAGLERCFFTSGGSESIDSALRLARQHFVAAGQPGRWKIIGRELSYHGTTLAALSVGGHARRRAGLEPLLLELPKAPACYCLRCPLGRSYPACGVACADELAAVIEREGPETVAAFLAEPVVGSTAGAVAPPPEYWPRVAEVCRRYGVLLIADEVMTGFGRTGRRFGVEHWDVTPDILVGGKGLAGGYAPIGGVFARESVVEPIAAAGQDFMFYTFGGHPASCAAAERVLEIMEREDLVRRAAQMGELLRKELARLERHPNVAQVRGLGLLQAVELVRDRESLEPFPVQDRFAQRVVAAGLERGVCFYAAGVRPVGDVILLGPPFVVSAEEVAAIAGVLEESIDAARRAVAGG